MRSKITTVVVLCVVFVGIIASNGSASVRFDGLTWYHTENPELLKINEDGQLVWLAPMISTQLTVKLPEMNLTRVGDAAEVVYMLKLEGVKTGVPATDPTLLSGTGDLRVGLFDSNGVGHIDRDKTGYKNDKWQSYLGYCARICPCLPVDIEREHSDAIPGKFMKRSNKMGDDVRKSLVQTAGPYTRSRDLSGFGLELGKFSRLILRIERKAENTLEFSVTLNGITYIYVDDEPKLQPKKIDALAIYYPNPKKYTSITLAGCCFSCKPISADKNPRTYISGKSKNKPEPVK
ncbi:MAG: hypothetical protein E4H40_03490 [Candidatus Brocadiia bacterium]|nr:MAG: hypothetical protein E4H40_03490 [Candidatus Brocadiia bacterium]